MAKFYARMDIKDIGKRLTQTLSPHDFTKNGREWCKSFPYGLLIVQLQGSKFGTLPYVNVGIWIEGVDATASDRKPRWLDCGVQGRIERIDPIGREIIGLLFSEWTPRDSADAIKKVGAIVHQFRDKNALRLFWDHGKLNSFLSTPEARKWLTSVEE
jgi:hypothetical protein